jgi:hypothetical protein
MNGVGQVLKLGEEPWLAGMLVDSESYQRT